MKKILCFFLLVCAGCNVQPTFYPPCLDVPDHWRTPVNETTDMANLRWWESWGDPVLDELIETALAYNQNLYAATERVREFLWLYRLAYSELYPQIGANVSASRQETSTALTPVLPGTSAINNAFILTLNLSYEIDFWGKIRSLTDAALAEFLSQIQVRQAVILTLVASVASSYIQLRKYDAQLEVSKQTYQSRQESVRLAILRYEGGLTSEIEVRQQQAEADDALIQVKRFEELIPQEENLLSVLIGSNPRSIMRGRTLAQLDLPMDVPVGLPSCVIMQRPDILSAEQQLIAANARIGVARAEFFPQVTLTGLFGYESTQLSNLFSASARTWQIGVNAMQFIFDGQRRKSRLRITEAQKQEAIYNYIFTIQTAFKEVDDALIEHKKSKEILVVSKDQVEVLTDYLHLAWLRYYNGETDYLNVLDAQRQLFRAQLDYVGFQADTFRSLIDIYKSLGGGWVIEADLNLIPCICY